MLVCERHPELEKCRQLAAFKYLERKSQLPNEALIGIVLFCPRWFNFERLPSEEESFDSGGSFENCTDV